MAVPETPADALPFGIQAKVAYATGLDGTNNSGNGQGATVTESDENLGSSATEYQVKAAPIDGLTVGASYIEFSGAGNASTVQDPESGAYYATYATGPVSLGYSKGLYAPYNANGTAASYATLVDYYDQTNYSFAFAATDDLSVSYEVETSEKRKF